MTSPSGRTARAVVGALGLAVATAALQVPTAAQAAPTPKQPTGLRVVAVSDGGFTVALKKSRYAKKYRIWATTTKSRLALSTVRRTKASGATRTPRVTIRGLGYTAAPYYFRVQAIGQGKSRYSGVYSTRLRASAPTGLRVTSSRLGGVSLTWGGRAAARYVVQQATNPSMNRGVRTWATRSVAQQFSPYGLRPGTRYWFRARAENGSASAWTGTVSAVAASRGLAVRAMTYNVMKAELTGARFPSGAQVAPWSTRGPQVLANIRSSGAQVVGLQEAAGWTDRDPKASGPGVRQADWIRARLGAGWVVAGTEPTPGSPGWKRTGRYVLFNGNVFTQRAAGTWVVEGGGNPTKVAWAVLTHRTTGARVLVVSAHLYQGSGAASDRRRQVETQRLVSLTTRAQAAYGARAVYLGDFNSARDPKHPLDGPGVTFRAARTSKADQAATSLSPTARYNSNNQGYAPGPAKAVQVDAVWAPPGVGVSGWRMILPVRGRSIPSDHNPVVADVVLPF